MHAIVKKIAHGDKSDIESFNYTRFYSELMKILSDCLKHVNNRETCNNDLDVIQSKEKMFRTVNNERKYRYILLLPQKKKHVIMIKSLCIKLNQFSMTGPFMVKEFETDFVDNELAKINDVV